GCHRTGYYFNEHISKLDWGRFPFNRSRLFGNIYRGVHILCSVAYMGGTFCDCNFILVIVYHQTGVMAEGDIYGYTSYTDELRRYSSKTADVQKGKKDNFVHYRIDYDLDDGNPSWI